MHVPFLVLPDVLAVMWGAAACGEDVTSQSSTVRTRVIDEMRGTYRGVRLESAPAAVHAIFGPKQAARENEPGHPLKGEAYGASAIVYSDRQCPSPIYRYDYVAFGFHCGKLLWIETTEPSAETARGVAVGDPLARVEEVSNAASRPAVTRGGAVLAPLRKPR